MGGKGDLWSAKVAEMMYDMDGFVLQCVTGVRIQAVKMKGDENVLCI